MPFSLADLKNKARRALHEKLSVAALYQDNVITTPEPIRVRYHNKIVIEGDPYGLGQAETIEGADKVVLLNDPDMPKVRRGGIITIAEYDLSLRLETQEPHDGPVIQTWRVSRA